MLYLIIPLVTHLSKLFLRKKTPEVCHNPWVYKLTFTVNINSHRPTFDLSEYNITYIFCQRFYKIFTSKFNLNTVRTQTQIQCKSCTLVFK